MSELADDEKKIDRATERSRHNRYPIPTYSQLDNELGDIEADLLAIRKLWRWAQADSHRSPKRGSRDIVTGGDPSDVADKVTATDRYRSKLRHAARELTLTAKNAVRSAREDLNEALLLLDPPPSGPEVADVKLLPHPATKADVAAATKAQSRRKLRAVLSGDWAEVTG